MVAAARCLADVLVAAGVTVVRGESKTSTGQSPPKGKAYSEGERQISSPRPKMGLNSCCHTARFTLTHATKPRQTAMPHTPIAPSIPASNSLRIPELRKLKSFENAYNGAFSIVAYATNRYLIDHMLRVGRMLTDNDFEAMVIWGARNFAQCCSGRAGPVWRKRHPDQAHAPARYCTDHRYSA